MKKLKILLIIIILFSLTGCSYVELNKLAIVSALGIDYKDNLLPRYDEVFKPKSRQ